MIQWLVRVVNRLRPFVTASVTVKKLEINKDKLVRKLLAIDENLLGFEPHGQENVFYSRKVNTSSYFNSVCEMSFSKASCTFGETTPSGFFEQSNETSPEA